MLVQGAVLSSAYLYGWGIVLTLLYRENMPTFLTSNIYNSVSLYRAVLYNTALGRYWIIPPCDLLIPLYSNVIILHPLPGRYRGILPEESILPEGSIDVPRAVFSCKTAQARGIVLTLPYIYNISM